MTKYLLEIGTEELPAGQIADACARLEETFTKELGDAGLTFSTINTISTPRRLAVFVDGLADKQPTTTKKIKGPPVKASFDEGGSPKPQATGFAEKNGLKVEQLDKEEVGKELYLFANVTIEGKPAADVLADIAPKAILSLSFERPMRWGNFDLKFSRPIRWIVSMLDSTVVPFTIDTGMKAGNETQGHRILAPGKIQLAKVDDYIEKLRAGKVIARPEERQELIEKQVNELAQSVNGKARRISGPLLEEVVNITEWPQAVIGKFSDDYLELPDTLLETIMVHHQRYFPVEKPDAKQHGASVTANNLLPYFITISNNDSSKATDSIAKGNERVLRARLADGKFFYFDDQKTKLSARQEKLSQLTYQKGLGNYRDKTDRLSKLAAKLSDKLKLEANISVPLERAMGLFKLDLVTNLVGELPELQGYVGAWYAEREGEPPEVVRAIASHYSPRHTADSIPDDNVGRFVGILDKIDHVTGLFALGKKPSGSSDPFALRRNAQGLVDILIDGLSQYAIDINWLIDELLDSYEPMLAILKKIAPRPQIKADIEEFLTQRLRGKLLDMGFGREIVDAVLSARCPLENMGDTVIRCRSIEKLVKSTGGLDIIRAGVRVGNILKPDSPDALNESKLAEPIEKELWKSFNELVKSKWEKNGKFEVPKTEAEYDQMIDLLRPLAPTIDKFFDDVMVNDPDTEKKNNRHALLKSINKYFAAVAIFPKLQPLI